jgi:hypothetical protein
MYRVILCLFLFNAFVGIYGVAQDEGHITLQGIVRDNETKEGLAGASIRISGSSIGTHSDLSGRFSLGISKPNRDDSLIVTFVGYKKYSEALSNLTSSTGLQIINMTNQPTSLKEVVVRSEFWLKQYSPKDLMEDYTKFYTIMEKVHTGLFNYLSEREWQALKDSSLQLIKYPMTHSEFYQLIALHVGKVRNIHTRYGVTDWWIKQKQNIFPFKVKYFDDRMYISESLLKDQAFPKGCEILEINGKTPGEIKTMIWPYIPADGFIQTSKLADLSDYFSWYFSMFVEEADSYKIKLRTLTGEEETITTQGLRDSFRHLIFQQEWNEKKSSLELKINGTNHTAYFRIEDSRVFKDSLQTYFQRIVSQGIQYLIIDLRGRGGIREGEQVADLYSYLVDKPFRAYEKLEVKSNDYTLFDKDFTYKPYANSLREIKEQFFDKLIHSDDGCYLWQEESMKKLSQPASLHFTGAVYILTDGRNYSASTSFTSLASQLDNVFVVGEETGGEYRSYVSGAMFGLVLPNSKVGIKIATWKSILDIEEKPSNRGRGVIPDYPVPFSLRDFINGTDVVKEFAYKLISTNSK